MDDDDERSTGAPLEMAHTTDGVRLRIRLSTGHVNQVPGALSRLTREGDNKREECID